MSLVVVDDLDAAIALFNEYSPRLVASLLSEDPDEQQRFWSAVDAPFVGDGFTRWVDGQFAFDRPELGLSNWRHGLAVRAAACCRATRCTRCAPGLPDRSRPAPVILRGAGPSDLAAVYDIWYATEIVGVPNPPPPRTMPWFGHLLDVGRLVVAEERARGHRLRRATRPRLVCRPLRPVRPARPPVALGSARRSRRRCCRAGGPASRWPPPTPAPSPRTPGADATRWPAYYLSATAGQVREARGRRSPYESWPSTSHDWPLPGDVPYHRALGARPLAVDREGVRLGTALVVDASPQRLFHPDTTEVLETTVDDADDAAPVVLAVVAHLLRSGVPPASSSRCRAARRWPRCSTGLRHHGRGHGLRERVRSARRSDPPHDARRVTGGDRGVAPPVGLSERRLSGSIGRRPLGRRPLRRRLPRRRFLAVDRFAGAFLAGASAEVALAGALCAGAFAAWRWCASWPLGGGPLAGAGSFGAGCLAAERRNVSCARRGARPSWSCRRRLPPPRRRRPRRRRAAGSSGSPRTTVGRSRRTRQAPAAEEPAGQVGHLTEGPRRGDRRRARPWSRSCGGAGPSSSGLFSVSASCVSAGATRSTGSAHGGQHAAGRLRRLP